MRHVSLLVKPASGRCNMQCRYCFYHDLVEKRAEGQLGIMDTRTTEELVAAAFRAAEPGGEVHFTFQGGEPTLAGLDYFRQFAMLEGKYARPDVEVSHSIQTNGLCIDRVWAQFFRQHNYLVGLSVDGGAALHDSYRVDTGGRGTWEKITAALRILQAEDVAVNLLCVVTGQCAQNPGETYNALKGLGCGYLQFIPCLDPQEEERGGRPFSLLPEDYGHFLCTLFDEWYTDWKNGRYVSVRLFDDYIHLMMGLPAGACSTTGACGGYLVAEADGSLYPCDFYALDRWQLGRMGEMELEEAAMGEMAMRFQAQSRVKPTACADCRWRALCGGGCKRDWVEIDGRQENHYCSAFRRLFAYAETRMREIARAEMTQR